MNPLDVQTLDDSSLVAHTARQLVPSEVESSFLIHAPLELLARAALLPLVPEAHRGAARRRIAAIADRYQRDFRPAATPAPLEFEEAGHATRALQRGLDEGNSGLVDSAVLWLAARHDVKTLRRLLLPLVVDRVGLAAHAPILFAELPRVNDRLEGVPDLLRAPMHTLSKERGTVMTRLDSDAVLSAQTLEARLGATPHVPVDSFSIAPRLRGVQPLVTSMLAGVERLPTETVRRSLLRVAAQSMLEDDPESAPYIWTHCLTLPLAVLENADVMAEVGAAHVVAATHVLAFRATSGRVTLSRDWQPTRALIDRFAPGSPSRAAALRALVVRAALHHDAHLVKYTRACLDAAAHDPGHELLFFAAAERLGAWWDEHPNLAD
ncbi:MAG: hypothetical protein JNM69_23595 [Archangium sp.]|nr:hypothetical protein [Archangium sp.]